MLIAALLVDEGNINCHNAIVSKKRILENMSYLLAANTKNASVDKIFQALLERERLGTTGLGKGVAIPHARIPGLTKTIAAMMTLETPVNYESSDKQAVDIVFGLLVPEEEGDKHLEHLARLVSLFRNVETCKKIRTAKSAKHIFEILLAVDDD